MLDGKGSTNNNILELNFELDNDSHGNGAERYLV